MTRQAALYYSRKRRITATRVQGFQALNSSPANLASPVVLPEAGFIGISFSVIVITAQLSVETNTGRTLDCPALAANEIHKLGFFEKGVQLTVTASIAGNATLYVYDDWGRTFDFATGDPPG